MSTELAQAYVTLIPSLKGAQTKIQSELSGINLQGAGKAMGSSLTSGMSSTMANAVSSAGALFSSTFGKVAKVGTGAMAAIGTGLAGLAAKGGLTRALNLEQAQTMFKGLKLDWAQYKDTVQAAVDGTAFTMDAAALTAASLAAAGVGAGDSMKKALNGAVGVAATFGSDLGEIGQIFSKVAAQGKLTGETIQQFADRGINATSVLAQYLNKSGDEIREMVKKGEVDFQTFSDAMYSAFGDSAMAANETFTGSLANMRSALNKIGENFMTPFKDNAIPVFNAVRESLNAVRGLLDPVVTKFASLANIVSSRIVGSLQIFTERLKDGSTVMSAIQGAIDHAFGEGTYSKIMSIITAIGTLATLGSLLKTMGAGMSAASKALEGISRVSGMLSSVSSSVTGFVSNLGGASLAAIGTFGKSLVHSLVPQSVFSTIGNLSADLAYGLRECKRDLLETFSGVRESIAAKFNGIGEAVNARLGGVPGKIGSTLSSLKSIVGESVGNAADAFRARFNLGSHAEGETSKLSAAFGKIKSAAGTIGGPLVTAAGGLTAVAGGLLVAGVAAAAAGVDVEGAANKLLNTISGVTANLPTVAQQFASVLPGLVTQVAAAMPALVSAFQQAMMALVSVLPAVLPEIVAGLTSLVTELVPVLVNLAPLLLDAGLQLFTALLNSLAQVLPLLIEQIPTLVEQLTSVLIANMPLLLEAGLTLFIALVTAFVQMTPQLISKLPELISSVTSTLIGFLPMLAQAAVTLFMAIASSVPQVLDAVLGALGDLLSQLPGKVVEFAGAMGTAAMQMIQGMVQGIADAGKWVIDAIGNLCDNALDAVKGFFGIASPSKLMRKMWGFVGVGAALGIEDLIPRVVSKMKSLVQGAERVAEEFSPEMEDAVYSSRIQDATDNSQRVSREQEQRDLIEALSAALKSAEQDKDTTIILQLDHREFMRWQRKVN